MAQVLPEINDNISVRPFEGALRRGHFHTHFVVTQPEYCHLTLFQNQTHTGDTDFDASETLQSYIARHFGESQRAEAPADAASESAQSDLFHTDSGWQDDSDLPDLKRFDQVYHPMGTQAAASNGTHLNKLDREMPSGLESLLPTPLTRFRVMRKRLGEEIAILEAQLAQCEKLWVRGTQADNENTREMKKALRNKLGVLKRHESQVNFSLAGLNGEAFNGLSGLIIQAEAVITPLSQKLANAVQNINMDWVFIGNPHRRILREAMAEVEDAKQLLIQAMAEHQPDPKVVSELSVRYERSARKLQKVVQSVSPQKA